MTLSNIIDNDDTNHNIDDKETGFCGGLAGCGCDDTAQRRRWHGRPSCRSSSSSATRRARGVTICERVHVVAEDDGIQCRGLAVWQQDAPEPPPQQQQQQQQQQAQRRTRWGRRTRWSGGAARHAG